MLIDRNYRAGVLTYQNTCKTTPAEKFDAERLLGETETEVSVKTETDYNQKALETIGANAPENVRQAWMEAAEEVGANGMGVLPNGMLGHITQLQIQRGLAWMNGETDCSDVLGNSVTSAISAVQKALYDLEHPLEPVTNRSIEVQQLLIKEREFYSVFLKKLEQLQ